MNIVYSSLNEYQHDIAIIDKMLLEGVNVNDVKKIKNPSAAVDNLIQRSNKTNNNSLRIKLLIGILTLVGYMTFPRSLLSNDDIKGKAIELAKAPEVKKADVYNATKELSNRGIKTFLAVDENKISKLNSINPNRFHENNIDLYNKFDHDIISAIKDLKARGENPDAKLIKGVMLMETGMLPRKNKKGFEGFPQTKMKFVRDINRKYKTNFSRKDLYNARESAKFIHYMLKAQKRSKYINTDKEALAAYNWGMGNWRKYKLRKIDKLPKETSDYVKLISAFMK